MSMSRPQNKHYTIRVRTLGGNILTFTRVVSFTTSNGLITFKDTKTGKVKMFAVANCEIEEVLV